MAASSRAARRREGENDDDETAAHLRGLPRPDRTGRWGRPRTGGRWRDAARHPGSGCGRSARDVPRRPLADARRRLARARPRPCDGRLGDHFPTRHERTRRFTATGPGLKRWLRLAAGPAKVLGIALLPRVDVTTERRPVARGCELRLAGPGVGGVAG